MGFDIALLFLANALWGSTDVVAKFALSEMTPATLTWMRFTIALLVFSPVLWKKRSEIPRSLGGLLPFAGIGLCGCFLNFVVMYYGLRITPASHATALRMTESLIILVLSVVLLRERVGKMALIGLGLGTLGVIMLLDIDIWNLSLFGAGSRYGDLLIITAAFLEALITIIGSRVLSQAGPFLTTALACLFGWLMLSLCYCTEVIHMLRHGVPSFGVLMACAYLGIFATVFAYGVYFVVLSRRPSHQVGSSIMIQPLVGIPLAAIVFHEVMTPIFLMGATCIAVGVYLALARPNKKDSSLKSEGKDPTPNGTT